MEKALKVFRAGRDRLTLVGYLDDKTGEFSYDTAYLEDSAARPVSFSLPLTSRPYTRHGAFSYFEGLVPEGNARSIMAAELHVREDDYAAMLKHCGLDCIGDL